MSNVALNRTVAACYENGSTNIPLPKSLNRTVNTDKWRAKYEDSEKKRKLLIAQQERASRNYLELEKKFKRLELQNTVVEGELSDKISQFRTLRTASQNMCTEYETLKNKYELETGALHRALSDATGWYRQNRELKRQSARLLGTTFTDVVDIGDTDDEHKQLEGLRESIIELSASNAKLQTELNEAKLTEFESTEQVVNLTQEVDELERKCQALEAELNDVKTTHEQIIRVSKIMTEELKEFRENDKLHREEAVVLRHQADDARKERNVLAHQSTLLLAGIANDEDKVQFLQEIENLKRQLEDMTNKYERDIAQLQEKLEQRENDSHIEILEERLKLVESELQRAQERAERLENQSKMAPTPPPPPPLPLMSYATSIKPPVMTYNSIPTKPDVNDAIPTLPAKKLPPQPQIDDIVNQIKGGKFTLKSTNKPNRKDREEPKAVNEMLHILSTLRRSPRPKTSMQKTLVLLEDVQL